MIFARKVLLALIASPLLASCAVQSEGPYRDTKAPIGVTTRFDAALFSGSWTLWEAFGPAEAGTVVFEQVDGSLRMSGSAAQALAGDYSAGVQGELIPDSTARETLVVMWVDEDFETAAIGTVSGSFGAILDRDGIVPPDRAKAARGILSFYGWDVSALERTAL